MTEPEDSAEIDATVADDDATAARRRRWLRLGVFGAFVGVAAALVVPTVPRDQSVRLHLGAGSSKVVRATARVSRDAPAGWERETTWRFDHGAPPSIQWSFELPNGDAEVEVELASAASVAARRTKIALRGDETSVELAEAMRGLE